MADRNCLGCVHCRFDPPYCYSEETNGPASASCDKEHFMHGSFPDPGDAIEKKFAYEEILDGFDWLGRAKTCPDYEPEPWVESENVA